MNRTWQSAICGAALVALSPVIAYGQEKEATESKETTTTTEEVSHKPLKFSLLRQDEDWSTMRGNDWFDNLKDIDLGNGLRLDIGGSFRLRMMSETNKGYGAPGRVTNDTFLLQQYRLHANIRYEDVFRIFVEGIHAQVDERQTPAIGIDENFYDIHQAFIDWKPFGSGTNLKIRFGRQELAFGAQRLVSPLPWGNTRRQWDGLSVFWHNDSWKLHGFYTRPVPVNRGESLDRKWDEYDADQHFFGLHGTYKGWENHGLDLYYLVLLDQEPGANANVGGFTDNLTLHTIGSRWWGKSGPWDYEAEGAAQFGHWGGDEIFAWMVALKGGYTFKDVPMTPRLELGFDWATGDHDPYDNQHNTFNQLFPLGHAYFGYLDQIARQNIISPHIAISFKPCKPVKVNIAYHQYFLDQNDDALRNAGGAAVRRDLAGNSGSAVGGEMDVTVSWKIDQHQSLLLGWSHMWPGGFIEQTGDTDEPNLFYIQYAFNF